MLKILNMIILINKKVLFLVKILNKINFAEILGKGICPKNHLLLIIIVHILLR